MQENFKVKRWTHWVDVKGRIWLVVDYNITGEPTENIVIVEVKEYADGEAEVFQTPTAGTFLKWIERGTMKRFVPVIPTTVKKAA